MRASIRIENTPKYVPTIKIRPGLYVAKNRGKAVVQFFGETDADDKPPARVDNLDNQMNP